MQLNVRSYGYAVLTVHRPQNVDCPGRLRKIIGPQTQLRELVTVFPVTQEL